MSEPVVVRIVGLDRVLAKMSEYANQIRNGIGGASQEVADTVLDTEGLRRYPPETAANREGRVRTVNIGGRESTFRMGFYIRGRGAQIPTRDGGYRDLANSERYGTQFYSRRQGMDTLIGNRAGYARYLAGDEQARVMESYGWRKLIDVAQDKRDQIAAIYQAWLKRIQETVGL